MSTPSPRRRKTSPTPARSARLGSSFDDFLSQEGILAQATAVAEKRVLAHQLAAAMKRRHLSKSALARRMHTSRMQVDRVLDCDHPGVTLDTLARAAQAVGMRLHCELVEA